MPALTFVPASSTHLSLHSFSTSHWPQAEPWLFDKSLWCATQKCSKRVARLCDSSHLKGLKMTAFCDYSNEAWSLNSIADSIVSKSRSFVLHTRFWYCAYLVLCSDLFDLVEWCSRQSCAPTSRKNYSFFVVHLQLWFGRLQKVSSGLIKLSVAGSIWLCWIRLNSS